MQRCRKGSSASLEEGFLKEYHCFLFFVCACLGLQGDLACLRFLLLFISSCILWHWKLPKKGQKIMLHFIGTSLLNQLTEKTQNAHLPLLFSLLSSTRVCISCLWSFA